MKEKIKEIKKKIQDYKMELGILEKMAEYDKPVKKIKSNNIITNSKPIFKIRITTPWLFKGVAHIKPNIRKKEVIIC